MWWQSLYIPASVTSAQSRQSESEETDQRAVKKKKKKKKKMLLVSVILFLGAVRQSWAKTRTLEYYIGAVETTWNYLDSGDIDLASSQR